MSTGPAGDAGPAQGDGQQGEAQGQGQDALAEALAANQATQQEMFEYLRSMGEQQPQQQQQQPEQQQPDPLDLSWLDDGTGMMDTGQMATQLSSLIESTVDQRVKQGIDSAVTPLQEQMQEAKREQDFAALIGEFPELGEEETATKALQMTGQLAQAVGRPELAGEPWMVRLTYLAGRAVDTAQQEGDEIPAPAHMESGAGAAPAGGPGGMTADQIVGARRGASVLPFG